MAANGIGRVNRAASKRLRDRLAEAEATLAAIRTGQVDALVISGPLGDQTVTIEGASHPYFVLLNAMSDGAALLDSEGAILFGNRSLSDIAGLPMDTLRGSRFQELVVSAERASFDEFLREGSTQHQIAREFALAREDGAPTPTAIALCALPLERTGGGTRPQPHANSVLMAIITDLSFRKAAEATRTGLLESLIAAEDNERRRIARELHDETGQSLTALLVGLRAIADMTVSPQVKPIALRLRAIAAQTVEDVGRLARGLHPAVLDDMGLGAAALRYANDYMQAFGTVIEFTAGDVCSPRLPPLASATMYRILQEALTNVARHAHATHIAVELNRDDLGLELVVRDDGVGFEASRSQAGAAGLGLNGMRERVTLLGGSLEIISGLAEGVTVRARLPVHRAPPPKRAKRRVRLRRD